MGTNEPSLSGNGLGWVERNHLPLKISKPGIEGDLVPVPQFP